MISLKTFKTIRDIRTLPPKENIFQKMEKLQWSLQDIQSDIYRL